MTTEHVSVPRTVEDVRNWHLHQLRTLKEAWQPYEHHKACAAILSRATPSDVVPEHIGHPRSPGETRDEIEMFLRDAYAAGCNAALRNSLVVAMEYARREAPKLRAILEPIAPSVVTDEDVERACKARFPETWGMMAENLKVIYRATSRRMLESFATSLPAAIPPGYVLVPIEPTKAMCDAYMQTDDEADHSAGPREVVARDIYKAMLTAASQAGEGDEHF